MINTTIQILSISFNLSSPNVQEHFMNILRKICTIVFGKNNNKPSGSTAYTGERSLLYVLK